MRRRLYRNYSYVLLITICIAAAFGAGKRAYANLHKNNGKEYTISGTVTQTRSYCGGANPPEELLKSLASPQAYPNKKFYVRRGDVNSLGGKVIKQFTTDSSGAFTIRLAPGIYAIIQEEQVREIKAGDYEKGHMHADMKCLQQWWKKPYYVLRIKNKNISHLDFNFHHRCYIPNDIPCITYQGPIHP